MFNILNTLTILEINAFSTDIFFLIFLIIEWEESARS